MGDGAALLKNFLMEKFGIIPEPQYGQSNPTFPVGHPMYGRPMNDAVRGMPSLGDMQRNTLQLRRNSLYDRPGMQMLPGYDPYIDQLLLQEKAGPAL